MIIRKNIIFVWFFLVIFICLPACASLMMPPIIKATDQRQLSEVNRLLAAGVAVDTATKKGMTPLFAASAKGYDRIASRLIESGADVNAAVTEAIKYNDQKIAKWTTPLMAALWGQHHKIALMLIENGADITRTDDNGAGALFIAASQSDQQVVNALIDKGADVNAKLSNGMDVLMTAAANSGVEIVKRLLEKGADINSKLTEDVPVPGELHPILEGTNALMMAAAAGDTDSIYELLKAGADVSATNRFGETALMAACVEGHLAAVKLLVANGADVHGRTTEGMIGGAHNHIPKGRSTLAMAVEDGHVDVAKFLLKKGVDVNDQDDVLHMDALFRAARNGHVEVAKILIAAGADLYAENRKGGTALNAARHYGHGYIADLIIKARKKGQENKEAQEKKERLAQ
jgi:ankyrin repeat protein